MYPLDTMFVGSLRILSHETFPCTDMAMDQYLLIPFLVGWTSIYQLFWCSPGVQGFDTLPYTQLYAPLFCCFTTSTAHKSSKSHGSRKLCTCNGRTEAGHQMTSAGVWNGVFEGPQELLEVFTHCELIMIWLCVPSLILWRWTLGVRDSKITPCEPISLKGRIALGPRMGVVTKRCFNHWLGTRRLTERCRKSLRRLFFLNQDSNTLIKSV